MMMDSNGSNLRMEMVYGGIEKQILTKSGKNGNDFVSIW